MLEDFKPLVAKGLFMIHFRDLLEAYHELTESFVPKNKFPEPLKEPLFAIGLAAVGTRDFDQSFFPVLTTILPYNKFTLTVSFYVFRLVFLLGFSHFSLRRNWSNVPYILSASR